MKTLLKLSKLISSFFPVMLLSIIFGTAGHLCAIAIPVLGSMALVGNLKIGFLIFVGFARGILHYVEQFCNHFIAFSILAKIRNKVFEKLRELGPAKLEGKEKGNLISLITSDIELLEVFYAHTVSPVFIATFVSVFMIIFFAHYSWILALVAAIFYALVAILIPCIVNKKAVLHGTEYRQEFAKMNSFLLDCLRGLEQSILFGNGKSKLEKIKTESDALALSRKKMALNEGFTSAISGLFVSFAGLTMLSVSLILYKNSLCNFNAVIVCTTGMFSSFGPCLAVAALGSSLSGTIASGNRVISLLEEKPIVENVENGINVSFTNAGAENVCFKYPKINSNLLQKNQNLKQNNQQNPEKNKFEKSAEISGRKNLKTPAENFNPQNHQNQQNENEFETEENILDNVSIEFPANKIIGIQGKSGSGKSTLLKLFMHFWNADSGKVEISKTSVQKINTNCLRKIESYVTQETVLFHDTIENNIRIAKLDATEDEIINACKKAELHDFIMTLPQKYKTQVAELGDNFSGGERQRLGLARAFLHKSDFILLDEPTSNLDNYNEEKIMESVKKESENKTIVIVSHRDSTFKFADKIFKLNAGRNS